MERKRSTSPKVNLPEKRPSVEKFSNRLSVLALSSLAFLCPAEQASVANQKADSGKVVRGRMLVLAFFFFSTRGHLSDRVHHFKNSTRSWHRGTGKNLPLLLADSDTCTYRRSTSAWTSWSWTPCWVARPRSSRALRCQVLVGQGPVTVGPRPFPDFGQASAGCSALPARGSSAQSSSPTERGRHVTCGETVCSRAASGGPTGSHGVHVNNAFTTTSSMHRLQKRRVGFELYLSIFCR